MWFTFIFKYCVELFLRNKFIIDVIFRVEKDCDSSCQGQFNETGCL